MTTAISFPWAPPVTRLRALALWQPFASLVADGIKTIETRLWYERKPGPWVVCSTQKIAPREMFEATLERLEAAGINPDPYLPGKVARGRMLCIADLVRCRLMTEEDESKAFVRAVTEEGVRRIAWDLAPEIVSLRQAPVRCGQSWFSIPVERLVRA